MKFYEVVEQVCALLQRQGRVSYRALKREFDLDDDYLEDLKAEIIKAKKLATDEDGEVLVWTGASLVSGSTFQVSGSQPPAPSPQHPDARLQTLDPRRDAGERRQLTVEFIDLVGSTTLSQQLDPEDYHARVVAYQAACRQVIERYDGHIAQYLGDGVLVYFGYPAAHDEDAVRAVRSGLDIVAAVGQLEYTPPLQVRIGIHTGPVVVSEIGAGERTERLALGETPNLAARLQGMAAPDTVVISEATQRLIAGLFTCKNLGRQELKGVSTPVPVYRVLSESGVQSRFEAAVQKGLTPLVGRTEELALLRRRWEHAKAGEGQVVLLSGEPGIGKSRLVQEFKEQLGHEGVTRLEFRCSPYHQNSALYPIIDHLQRRLQFAREDSPAAKLEKLQHTLSHYRFPQADTVPLLARLLSLPHPAGYPPITVSPQKQKEKTHAALVAWLVEAAAQKTVYNPWEDVHWADPSTLEVLSLVVDQAPTASLYVLLTFRPEFTPPWGNRSHLSQMTLSRLGRSQVEAMVDHVVAQSLRPLRLGLGQASTSSGRTDSGLRGETPPVRAEPVEARTALPPEVMQQIVIKTDGVPLFVEELTKTVLESVESVESIRSHAHMSLQAIAIPATLHDSLMARLDRLGTVKEVAQLGATLGREFSYELLQAVSPLDEETLQHGLKQLVEAELVYQRGLLPQAHYLFKHALIQDTAYQALLKSTRQQYHRQIAQVLAERFPETVETQPELLAQHYTEAGLIEQALPYWQRAGQRAAQRSAHVHLEQGIALYDSQKRRSRALQDPGVDCRVYASLVLWHLGYPDQALERSHEALTLAQELAQPFSLAVAQGWAALLHQCRQERHATQEQAEAVIALSTEQGFAYWSAWGTTLRGWALAEEGQKEEGIAQMRQGAAAWWATGAETGRPQWLALLAEAYGKVGQVEEGSALLAEALAAVHKTGERFYEAELYRLKGTLTLQSEVRGPKSEVSDPRPLAPDPQAEAEECFHKAIDIARRQQAKSLELRAEMSLSRLWQQQGKKKEAHEMLAEIYGWFTEGFDTKDLKEAKALLEELDH